MKAVLGMACKNTTKISMGPNLAVLSMLRAGMPLYSFKS